MALVTGTKAPDFSLPTKTADGPKRIKLSENFGKTNTLLLFFPMAFTGTCTTEMCTISNGLREYSDLKATVYGISGDNPFAQEAWAKKEKHHRAALERLRTQDRERVRRDARLVPAAR